MGALGWIFEREPDHGGRTGGIPSSESFDSTIATLVRESLQNCRDARIAVGSSSCARVVFTLEEISGARLDEFLDHIHWSLLEQHIDGSALQEYTEIGPKLRQGLNRLADERTLRIMRIEDHGTTGLTGPEIGKGNFDSLIKSNMINDPERTDSGGSYGLGKSVYWTFSELSTVLFASLENEHDEALFIGRADLASHEAEGKGWEGRGYFGVKDMEAEKENKLRAIALRGPDAVPAAESLGFERPEDETGTSIMIVGFDDPSEDEELGVVEICQEVLSHTTRWYWPALIEGTLEVEVIGIVDGQEKYRSMPPTDVSEMPADIQPFVRAFSELGIALPKEPQAAEPGETVVSEVEVHVPRKADGSHEQSVERVSLLARRMRADELGTEDYASNQGSIALLRGSGMVVEYRATDGDFEGHGVLLAGKAKPDPTDGDKRVDAFVRACEPPAHDEWKGDTNRARKEYKGGIATPSSSLRRLWQAINELLSIEDKTPPIEGSAGPPELIESFPLGGKDEGPGDGRRFILRVVDSTTTDRYVIKACFQRTTTNPCPPGQSWSFEASLTVAQDGGSINSPIPVDSISGLTTDCVSERLSDNRFTIDVGPDIDKVDFTVTSKIDPIPGTDLREIWPALAAKEAL